MLTKHKIKHSIAFVLILVLSSLFTTAVFAATVDDVNSNSLRVGVDVYNLGDAGTYTYENVLASLRRGGSQYYFKIGSRWYDLLRDDINSLRDLQDPAKAVPPAEVRKWLLAEWYCSGDTVQLFEPLVSTYKFEYVLPETVLPGKDITVDLTFATDMEGAVGHDAVLFAFSSDGPGEVNFTAEDSAGTEYSFTNEGSWGPEGGFPLAAEYHALTAWTLNFAYAGEYTITFSLVDAVTGAVIDDISESAAIEVWTPGDAKAAFLADLAEKAEEIDTAEVAVVGEDITIIFGRDAEVDAVYAVAKDLLEAFRGELKQASLAVKLEGEEAGETFCLDQSGVAAALAVYLLGGAPPEEFLDQKISIAATYSAQITDRYNVFFELSGGVLFTHRYDVAFNVNGGSEVEGQIVDYYETVVQPSPDPTKVGYSFGGWFKDDTLAEAWEFGEDKVTADITLYAGWIPRNDTAYVIEHYRKDAGADTYTLVDTDNLIGTTGAQTEAEAKTYAGYAAREFSREEIAADGSTIVKIYYDPVMVIGDEITDGEYVVNRDYIDYAMPNHDIGKVAVSYENQEITDFLELKYYTEEDGEEITTFNFDDGGTTLRVFVEAASEEYGSFSGYVTFKYRSVTIGKNDSYLTIEDALEQAKSGDTIYVKYNTSFAGEDVAMRVYGEKAHQVKSGVKLLLPYDSSLSEGLTDYDTSSGSNPAISRGDAYVELGLPPGIELDVRGELFVNAKRGNTGSRPKGYVTGNYYAQINMDQGSRITVGSNGKLRALGFVTGEGIVEAESDATVYELLFMEGWRGGNGALAAHNGNAFPLEQYTVNNIEVDMSLNAGARYFGNVSADYSGGAQFSDLPVIGPDNSYMFQLQGGQLKKSYDLSTGCLTLTLAEGTTAAVNNASIKLGGSTLSSKDRHMPFAGNWHFVVDTGATLNVKAWLALLPGSTMAINSGGTVNIESGGKLTVFDPYEVVKADTVAYPFSTSQYYRVNPGSFNYTRYTPAKLTVEGSLNVESGGGIAGRVTVIPGVGVFNLDAGCLTGYDYTYAMASGTSGYTNTRQVRLWQDVETAVSVTADKSSVKSGDKTEVSAHVKAMVNGEYRPLAGVTVVFSGGSGTWSSSAATTDANGLATAAFTPDGSGDMKLTAVVTEGDIATEGTVTVKVTTSGSGGCPLIYSYDGERFHLEHEPVPTSANKAFEGISFGTLRKLQEVDGHYHVRVGEDDPSETYVNGVRLYAVEYAAVNNVREMLVDIHGNPHTIGDRAAPKSFIDSGSNEWIGELLTEGKPVAAPGLSMLEQGRYIETYVANFDLPADAADVGKLIIKTQETNLTVDFVGWYHGLIDGCNNVWWLERALQSNDGIWGIIDAIGLLGLDVEVWDGAEWIYQGTVASGSHFFEEFLIPIDLGVLEEGANEVKVRLKSGAGFVMFEQVSMDFSQDRDITVYPLDLEQALYNGDHDVTAVVNQISDQRVKMRKGDYLDLYFPAPDLAGGKERGIFVDFTGYYHWGLESKTDSIVDTWDQFTYGEIIDAVLEIQPEASMTVGVLEWLFDLTETTLGRSMEYKIEKIYVEHALPWMKENLW